MICCLRPVNCLYLFILQEPTCDKIVPSHWRNHTCCKLGQYHVYISLCTSSLTTGCNINCIIHNFCVFSISDFQQPMTVRCSPIIWNTNICVKKIQVYLAFFKVLFFYATESIQLKPYSLICTLDFVTCIQYLQPLFTYRTATHSVITLYSSYLGITQRETIHGAILT